MKVIQAADLFCGAGGTTTGLARTCERLGFKLRMLAVNHWDRAIETHAANHPWADHLCNGLNSVKPEKAVPGGKLDLLLASPECTHHSRARGGKPRNDQSRASAWHVLYWCQELYIRHVIIENVPDFLDWGPLGADGKPLKSKRGETFRAFITAFRSLGYRVEWRVLTCADYGDATTRRRLFIQARRGNVRIAWPEPSHTERPNGRLFDENLLPWKPACDVIDWNVPSQLLSERKKPLSKNTLDRIRKGIRRFWGKHAEPFLVSIGQTGGADRIRRLSEPLPTITTKAEHCLIEPLTLPQQSCGQVRTIKSPLSTISAAGAIGLIEPFAITYYSNGKPKSILRPLETITANDRFALVTADPVRFEIGFRMFQPHELAAAHSFPSNYVFKGNKSEIVKQIGNSVPVGTASALSRMAIAG